MNTKKIKLKSNLPIEVVVDKNDSNDEADVDEEEEEEIVVVKKKKSNSNSNSQIQKLSNQTNELSLLENSSNTSSNSRNDVLNMSDILTLFNCAISQEQAWAVLYQVLVEFRHLLDNNLELIKLNLDQIGIYLLNFAKDGSILFSFKKYPSQSNSFDQLISRSDINSEKTLLESKVLKSIAYLIFDALDYGNANTNEPVLQSSLSHLLLLISGHYKEYGTKGLSEDDEGYEQEEEDSINLDKAIEVCQINVAEPEYHYKAVCRGLYAQAYELKAFLAKIEDSKNTVQKSGDDAIHYCFEVLDRTDWAKLWMQVIHELRNGVKKLRKVSEKPEIRRHIEYELTPFEILLDQIRTRRYHLRKVSLDKSLGPEIKKDARDIILDFIRSRPPLKKSSLRCLPQNDKVLTHARSQPINLHEQLMNSIRNHTVPLRKMAIVNDPLDSKTNKSDLNLGSKDSSKVIKRLLKPDKKLLSNLTSSDDDDSDLDYDELKNLPILQEEEELGGNTSIYISKQTNLDHFNDMLMNITSSSCNNNHKKRIKAPECLKSPLAPWIEPVENWQALVTEDVLVDSNLNNQTNHASKLNRRHTTTVADLKKIPTSFSSFSIFNNNGNKIKSKEENTNKMNSNKVSDKWKIAKSRLMAPIYFKSGPGYHDFGFVSTQELIKKISSANEKNGQCLKLTFEELCHIRNVLTKAELDYLLFDNQIYYDVSRGKVCFSCRKTKFHIFNWLSASKCRICQQKICKKCLRSAQLKNGQIAQVPLFKLCPSKHSIRSKNDSLSNSSDNEDYDVISCKIQDNYESEEHNFKNNNLYLNNNNNQKNGANSLNHQLFDICVDCYQIMDGVIVSASEIDLGLQNQNQNLNQGKNSPVNGRKKSSNKEFIKSVHLANKKSGLNSPSSIGMDFIKDMKVNNKAESSPISNKIMASHHSTPTQWSTNTPAIASLEKSADLSTIIVQSSTSENFGEDFDSFNQNNSTENSNTNKHLRLGLTLDLQPVYSN